MSSLAEPCSRRAFARLIGASAAFGALRPVLSGVPAQAQQPSPGFAPRRVRLSANENPYGPPPAALAAMTAALATVCRYPDELEEILRADVARHLGVAAEQVLLGNGSSQILQLAATALSGPGLRVVTADPTFEALGRYAETRGAEVVRVPLTRDHRHDLAAMARAAGDHGLVYLCNPNNPTATITPAGEISAFLDHLPGGVMVLLDEAYHHYAVGVAGYESAAPGLAKHPSLLVVRTFSKIYGMAGLRCGYAAGAQEKIERLRRERSWDSLNVMALAAAHAALGDAAHVELSRARNREVLAWTAAGIERAGGRVLPSAANFLMADLGRDVAPLIKALQAAGVDVGRRFKALPNHLRVTIGTEEEMRVFLAAFERVMTLPAAA